MRNSSHGKTDKREKTAKGKNLYKLKVTLRGIRPPIWRKFLVRSDVTLGKLHDILQTVMGWTDSHLHQFIANNIIYGTPDPDSDMVEMINEKRVLLSRVLQKPKDRMIYEYDFGDGWEHEIVLEEVSSAPPRGKYPIVLAGRRACPPEDVGGPWGYAEFLEAIKNPKHPEHEEYLEWSGGSFDPERFDPNEINLLYHGGWTSEKE